MRTAMAKTQKVAIVETDDVIVNMIITLSQQTQAVIAGAD